MQIASIDVLILCGGRGTRLQSVAPDRPKPMVEVDNKPFLDLLIDHVAAFGFKRFVLCAGHQAEVIESHYRDGRPGKTIRVSKEPQALGTAGAIQHAAPFVESDVFLAMNGDSFCRVDLTALVDSHLSSGEARATVALAPAGDASDYGGVAVSRSGRILSFDEKNPQAETDWINAGVYVFHRSMLRCIPPGQPVSLEKELFPDMVGQGLYGFKTDSELFDIGTPERLERARQYLKS